MIAMPLLRAAPTADGASPAHGPRLATGHFKGASLRHPRVPHPAVAIGRVDDVLVKPSSSFLSTHSKLYFV